MTDLKTLKTVTRLSFFTNNVQNNVNKFSTLCVVTLSPIISSTSLAEYKVIRTKNLSKRTRSYRVHRSRFKVHENSAWYITTFSSFVEVDVDTFELKFRITIVCTIRVYSMFITNDFPKFSSNLITTLASLNMNYFTHLSGS
eukprot:gnl/TRDRNA2_/TRDRNA2_176109_c1_seq1.p3 gnl/TRDRNA2_/TRDRNA2_176109_c1~~gnl/TRDRNA2_/TRDRNA2_176109_c1_seq1.p3  ORF type:complete len:142 (-),score=0.05 gnl/TRDRNA2_/TRDRNA2_176109_c1_seq1:1596-2021(-)